MIPTQMSMIYLNILKQIGFTDNRINVIANRNNLCNKIINEI